MHAMKSVSHHCFSFAARAAFIGALSSGLLVGSLEAQRPRLVTPPTPVSKRKFNLPPGCAPPTGMCRIWVDNVPASQQPAPTDCASAVKNRPLNGRVIFGDDKSKGTDRERAKHEEV